MTDISISHFQEATSGFIVRRRVPLSILLFGIVLTHDLAKTPPRNLFDYHEPRAIGGAVLVLSGLAIRSWAAGILQKNTRLTTIGPYRLIRNPLYVGSFSPPPSAEMASAIAHVAKRSIRKSLMLFAGTLAAFLARSRISGSLFSAMTASILDVTGAAVPELSRHHQISEQGQMIRCFAREFASDCLHTFHAEFFAHQHMVNAEPRPVAQPGA